MKITLILIGKTTKAYLTEGINEYTKRIAKYTNFDLDIIPTLKNTKNLPESIQKQKEGELILKHLQTNDFVVLLDANGKSMSSEKFANWIESVQLQSYKRLVFVIGGAYGFSPEVYAKANCKISLSDMTFSHQIIRLIFLEQLYRAHTILNNEPYHH